MAEHDKIEYCTLLELNFKRKEIEDELFYNIHGYKNFSMEFKLSKRYFIEWDVLTRQCYAYKIGKNPDIFISAIPILNIDQLKDLIYLFKGT